MYSHTRTSGRHTTLTPKRITSGLTALKNGCEALKWAGTHTEIMEVGRTNHLVQRAFYADGRLAHPRASRCSSHTPLRLQESRLGQIKFSLFSINMQLFMLAQNTHTLEITGEQTGLDQGPCPGDLPHRLPA
ncbi:uncharacterized protein LOC144071916 [Stigmatopora argus]